MTFNNRIIRTTNKIGDEIVHDYSIREVYYEDGRPTSWTSDDMKYVGESVKELWEDILFRLEAFKAPVLDLVVDNGEEKLIELK